MKIAIFGSSGFIGKNLVKYLQLNNEVQEISLRNDFWENSINEEAEVFINLVGKAHDHNGSATEKDYYFSNVELTRQIFGTFKNSEAKMFIHISSLAALEEFESIKPLIETDQCNPVSFYGRSKRAAEEWLLNEDLSQGKKMIIIRPPMVHGITKQNQEQMVLTVCPTIGIAGIAFRYQNVYGPGQSLKNPYTGILSIFSTQIKNGNGINIFEDGKESRDFVFINDVVDATILGIEKEEANNQVFNVGTGIATDVITVAESLSKNYGVEVPIIISGNYRLGDIRHNFADLTKINSTLGFEPKFSFEQGLQQFTDWVNTQEVQEDKYQKSIDEMKAKGLYK